MRDIPIVVLTSTAKRHKFFANTLSQNFDVRGIVVEEKRPRVEGETKEENEIIVTHLKQRDEIEEKYFGAHQEFTLPGYLSGFSKTICQAA